MAGHVARTAEIRNAYRVWSEKLKGTDHLEDQDLDGRIILKLILMRLDVRVWTGFIWLRTGAGGRIL
jgi:hypothetical protein